MVSLPILSVLTFLPLIGAAVILLAGNGDEEARARFAQRTALGVSGGTLVLALALLAAFDPSVPGFQFMERFVWIPAYNISYIKGVDGISLWFVVISAVLTPVAVLAAIGSVKKRVREFMIALLVLETMMIGTFTALDLVLFYVFFEGVLIPMFLIIGVWGGEKRTYAAYKFFLYTLLGSVLMLVAVFAMALYAGTTDMTVLMGGKFPKEMALWLWIAFFASFAVKTPMWPFHTWLPYAHVEAPTAGSVILAGVLLKMGGYGFIRISLQMLPDASLVFAPLVIGFSLIAIVYASLVALAQTDMKKLVAYSSVAHMGYVTLGLFSFNRQGFDGAMMVMLSHAFVAGALFLCVGVVYDRLHTREIDRFGGLASGMPKYAAAFMVFTLAAIGLPGTSGFVGEFLSMQGAFLVSGWIAFAAALGIVLGAAYMLWLYRRLFFGPLDKADVRAMPDLNGREIAMFAPLLVLVLWMGVYPSSFINVYAPAADNVLSFFGAQAHEAQHD
ncbi:MAG: NADH-quinone oxidoreductase subunit M [Alphaproteobacteria bacterium]|nr:NADH-quinone oxidoreductase subunit M [Alphaproteobacteria bacterium]